MSQASIRVGKITVTAVSDGILKTGLDVILGLTPEECARLAGCAYDAPIYLPVNSFLIDLAGKHVLVDAGSGSNMQPTLGKLPDNLRAIGVPPEAITTILLTHLHPDHANGLIDGDGNAIFPNAELIVHEQESRFYLERDANDGDSERVRRTLVASKLAVAPYRGRIRTIPDGEALPGISAVLQPGHTRGHTCWLLQSGRERLLIWGDIVHLPSVQVPRPDAALVYDVDPVMAPETRAQVFDWVARERLRVAGAHLPYPGFGTITRQGDGGAAFAYTASP
ncbi:MAG: MBL fold metallo-hydrolase [Rhizobiales bacterium]|nr:MBL fold metallo-hydrolase [Hyphomicrobiales bacterium]